MSDETTPGRPYSGSLRQQIASQLGEAWPELAEDPVHLDQLAAQAMAVVQPYTDRLKAELRQLRTLFDETEQSLPIEQRRLLSISRMVFDRHAEGDALSRDDAADLAQRIVDEIGHSVTDEPALGPSFRVEIRRLQDLISRMRADYHTEIRQRAEAYQAAIASTAGDALEHRLCGMNLHAAIRRAEQAEAKVTSLLQDMATVARHIEDSEYGDADKAARQALGIAPGIDLPGRES